jgi:hypothetical protein
MKPDEKSLQQQPWLDALRAEGFSDLCVRAGLLCAVKDFNFTTAIVVGMDPVGYQRRYCFEHAQDARHALAAWDGRHHPDGPWIKCKGGGIDLLNPALR